MKKLKLNLEEKHVLSKEKMRKVVGADYSGATCMERTSSFDSCMSCLYNEAFSNNDWVYAIGCGVEFPACVALMAAACAGAAAGRWF